MREALGQARRAGEEGEVPIGAVLVGASGEILGRGRNASLAARDPSAHAEIAALRDAGQRTGNYRLGGSVLVATLEPCLMCVGAMAHARVAGLVYGAPDPAAGAVESRLNGLELPFLNHTVWFAGNVLPDECAALLHDFFRKRRGGTP